VTVALSVSGLAPFGTGQQRQAGIGIWLAADKRIGIAAIIAIASHLNMFIELI